MTMIVSTLTLILILTLTWAMMSMMEKEDQTMNSSFESGFESSNTSFIPFSSQYFMVAMIFLIFDLEIVMTMPMPMSEEKMKSMLMISTFLLTLTLLLFKEMKMSTIEWVK